VLWGRLRSWRHLLIEVAANSQMNIANREPTPLSLLK